MLIKRVYYMALGLHDHISETPTLFYHKLILLIIQIYQNIIL